MTWPKGDEEAHWRRNCPNPCGVCGSTAHQAFGIKYVQGKKVRGTGTCDMKADDFCSGPDLKKNGYDKAKLMKLKKEWDADE